ncbi:MAG: glycosyltransferase, partial [Erysipelotrichia bacterium]|nr:glycosyltransferase [Erysipelotrichia bacterium]
MKPEISVIVPVYNVENWLEECLNSIAAQTFSGYQVLLVNDGSTDGSLKILKQWETKDSRFKVITRENGGLSAARNTGLVLSENKYVVFVDSDDVIAPDYLKHLYEAAVNSQAD